MIPAWAVAAIEEWIDHRQTGDMTLVFRNGAIKHIRREDLVSAHGRTACPACGEPMEERDQGQTFVCRCGAKRTKQQVASAVDGPTK